MIWRFIIGLFCSQLVLANVFAEKQAVVLDAVIEADFQPENVFFLARLNDSKVQLQQGLLIEGKTPEGLIKRSGTVIQSTAPVKSVEYSVLVHGSANQFWFKYFPREEVEKNSARLQSVEGLREALIRVKGQLREWDDNLTEDKETLRRLRADAEVIGNLGRITRLIEQTDLLKEEKERLSGDIDRLHGFLKQASVQEPPKNFVRRQAELTGQLEELARLVQGVEESENARRSLSESELQRQLALIEETRLADANDLESQLKQLQQARVRLEGELGFDAGESAENYLSW